MKATAKDLRFHSKEILETVARGEEVIITFRGKPQAKLVPFEKDAQDTKEKNSIFGIWKDNKKTMDVERAVRKMRRGRFQ